MKAKDILSNPEYLAISYDGYRENIRSINEKDLMNDVLPILPKKDVRDEDE